MQEQADEPRVLPNTPDPELAYAAIYEVEKFDAELDSEKASYAARCRGIKDRRKAAIEEYRDRGLSKADILDAIAIRRGEKKIQAIRDDRETEDDRRQLDLFLEALARGETAHKARAEAGDNVVPFQAAE